jgi:hypothetical protein
MPSTDDPLTIFQLLARAGVPFVIIGGHAVNFHGHVRATEDTDLIFERSPDSESALLEALESIHACWISDERDPATGHEKLIPVSLSYVRGEHLMMLTTDLGFVDLYDYVPGFPDVPVADVFSDSIKLDNLRFVSLQWLRKLKQVAGRHKDLDDLEHLPLS